MAKELVIKVKVDGKDIDVAKLSIKEFNKQVGDLRKELEGTPIGTSKWKQINGDINELEKGFRKAKDAQQPLLESMGQLEGILGYVGRSIKGVGEAFTLLEMNPIIATLAALAATVKIVTEALGEFKTVSLDVDEATTKMSVALQRFKNNALAPLVDGTKSFIEWSGKMFDKVGIGAGVVDGAVKALDGYSKKIKEIKDNQGALNVELEKDNAFIRKQLELSGETNRPLKERIDYLDKAKKMTTSVFKVNNSIATVEAQQTLQKLTNIHAVGEEQVRLTNLIKKGDQESLASAFETLEHIKTIGESEVKEAETKLTRLAQLDEGYANSTRAINRRYFALKNKDKAADVKEENEFDRINREIKYKTEEAGVKNEYEKVRNTTKIEEEKLYDEIIKNKKLKDDEKIELVNKYNAYVVKKEAETADKIDKLEIEEFDKSLKRIQEGDTEEIKLANIKYETYKALYGEEDKRTIEALNNRYNIEENLLKKELNILYDRQSAGYNLTQDELAQIDKIKKALEALGLLKQKSAQTDLINADNKRKEELDHDLQFLKIKGENLLKGSEAYYQNKLDIVNVGEQRELAALQKSYDEGKIKLAQFEADKTAITDAATAQRKKLKEMEVGDYAQAAGKLIGTIGSIYNAQADGLSKEAETSEEAFNTRKQFQLQGAKMAAAAGLINIWSAPWTLDPLIEWPLRIGESVLLGITTSNQIDAINATKFTGGGAGLAPTALGKEYATGGLIQGPSHSGGGVPIVAEGGEAIMTRGAVTMFAPLLSQLNQLGGGTSFKQNIATGQAFNDAPAKPEEVIMKTYVVSQELTTQAEKSARLKNLSTL